MKWKGRGGLNKEKILIRETVREGDGSTRRAEGKDGEKVEDEGDKCGERERREIWVEGSE